MILFAVVNTQTHKRVAQFFEKEDADWFVANPPDHYKELVVEAFGSVG